jgi:hypothetical protein
MLFCSAARRGLRREPEQHRVERPEEQAVLAMQEIVGRVLEHESGEEREPHDPERRDRGMREHRAIAQRDRGEQRDEQRKPDQAHLQRHVDEHVVRMAQLRMMRALRRERHEGRREHFPPEAMAEPRRLLEAFPRRLP